MHLRLFLFVFLFFSYQLHAQKEWSNWYYNGDNLLTFKNGKPQTVKGFINPIPNWQTYPFHFFFWGRGGISYSDPLSGDVKFIISNRLGFSSNYVDFPNPDFIRSCPDDKRSYHIIPFTDNTNRFYVVQFQSAEHDLAAQETGLQVRCPNAIGLGYSIVDLSLNNGLGDFALTNNVIRSGLTGHITLIRHANQKDVWVVVHSVSSNQFYSYLFTDNGIQPPVVSSVGPFIPATSTAVRGYLTSNHSGNLIAASSGAVSGVMLFDFNNATGGLSNYRTLKQMESIGYLQFSPDDSKLYYNSGSGIFQYDFNMLDVESSLTKVYTDPVSDLIYDLQLAPDGKMYFTKTYMIENDEYKEYTGSIECPNLPQFACNINPKAINTVSVAFPEFINDFIKDPKAPLLTKFDLGKDTAVCFGSYKIKAPDGWESYKWNTGDTTNEITVTSKGLYYVLAGSTGYSCPQAYGYINVSEKSIKLDLGRDTTLCRGDSLHLLINNDFGNILWSNGSNTRDTIITNNFYGVVTAKDKNGCTTKDTISINYKYYPRAEFGPDTTLCNQQTLTLKMEPLSNPFYSGTYLWSNGSIKDSLKISSPGLYWGKVTFDGCTVSDTIRVDYISDSVASLGKDTSLCIGDSLLLTINNANSGITWSTGVSGQSIVVKNSGSYIVTVKNKYCQLSDTINVTFNPKPIFKLINDTTICPESFLTLEPAIAGDKYLWQNGATSKSISANKPGTYWLEITKNGCNYRDTLVIYNYSVPQVNLGSDRSFCNGDSVILNAGTGFSNYQWSNGTTSQQTVIKTAGSFSVKATTQQGCSSYDTLKVLNVYPNPIVRLNKDTGICINTSKILNAGNYSSYLWSNGSTAQTIDVKSTGIYSVVVTDQNGCKGSDTARITSIYPAPLGFLIKDTSICSYGKLTLSTNGNTYESYLWNTNEISKTITIDKPGIYWLSVKDKKGCSGYDTVNVALKECLQGFFMPTAFTPDGNGLNDEIKPLLFGDVESFEFIVYNRFGQIVFLTTNRLKGWDGTFKGIKQDPATFTWRCTYKLAGQKPILEKGTLLLIR